MFKLLRLLVLVVAAFLAAPPASAVPLSLIDATRSASLTITKADGDPFTQFGDPHRAGQTPTPPPIAGLEFQIRKVTGVDLTTNAGWEELSTLRPEAFAPTGPLHNRLGPARSATTDAHGKARFQNLDLGLYYVTEEPTSAQRLGFSLIVPFLVALPSTNVQGTGWNYDVEVNAKDQRIVAMKAAGQECVLPGQTFQYGISGTAPAADHTGAIASYSIADPLAAALRYQGNDEAFLTDVAARGKTERLDPADFQVTQGEANVVIFKLTESGLRKLAALRAGNPSVIVTWRFYVTLVHAPAAGVVRNRGYVLPPGYPPFEPVGRPGIPTNEVIVRTRNCSHTSTVTTPKPKPGQTLPPVSTTPPTTPPTSTLRTTERTTERTTSTVPAPRVPTVPAVPTVPVPVPGPGMPATPATPATHTPAPAAAPSSTEQQQTGRGGTLPMTGASVIGFTGTGLALLLAGALLVRRNNRKEDQQ